MDDLSGDTFPALRGRTHGSITPELETTRRMLWRAFQHGELSEDELARTLDQLEPRHAEWADDRGN